MKIPFSSKVQSKRRTRHIIRIGLFSPCGWGNIGDAAIQSAFIYNIRKRLSEVQFVGITLNPEDTKKRHGIQAIPLAGFSVPGYYIKNVSHFNPPNNEIHRNNDRNNLKTRLKHHKVLYNFVRTLYRSISIVKKELQHILFVMVQIRKIDLLVISGGGQLDDFWGGAWGQPWNLFKWSLIGRIYNVTVIYVSVGKSSIEKPFSRMFIRSALRLAKYRSYRDQNSKIAAQGLVNAQIDKVVPDLAFSFPISPELPLKRQNPNEEPLCIGFSPIAYCDPRVWPEKNKERYQNYVTKMAKIMRWLHLQGQKVFFFATDGPDFVTIQDIKNEIKEKFQENYKYDMLSQNIDQSVNDVILAINRSDLIIASRLHGVILSHLCNKPVLAISYDQKVDDHMVAIGQAEHCINIDSASSRLIIEHFKAIQETRMQDKKMIKKSIKKFNILLDEQYRQILQYTVFQRH